MRWGWQRWLVAALGALSAGLLIGIPTGIIETSFYSRMTPVLWWNYPVWAVTSILTGTLLATYVRAEPAMPRSGAGRLTGGGVLSAFAVGCPICNKLVVAALGVSGALTIWAPIQPLLGVGSVALLVVALIGRFRGERACRVSSSEQSKPEVARETAPPRCR